MATNHLVVCVYQTYWNGIAMGKTSPIQFFRQVKQEVKKVTWPSKKEVMRATIMVLTIVVIASIFFFLVDSVFAFIVKTFLGQ